MRSFLIACLFTIALAAPQGYNYNQGSTQYTGAIATGQHTQSFSAAPALPAPHYTQPGASRPHNRQQLPAIVSKNIYIHSAQQEPDEEITDDSSSEQQHKHYNVVFIKAPHQSVKQTAVSLSNALNEEKTVIYVLSKKNDVSEIQQAIHNAPNSHRKPEVFFIKYKTPEEAQHAQQTIQAQYDALGGSTQISDEGFAPVSNYIGSLGHGGDTAGAATGTGGSFVSGGTGGSFGNGGTGITANTVASGNYLPPSKIK